MRRVADQPELMDGPLDSEVLRVNLRDLVRANRWLGGIALSRRALEGLIDAQAGRSAQLRMLDVGTGAADIPAALLSWARARGSSLAITAVDERSEMVAIARQRTAHLTGLLVELTEGHRLRYPNKAFDVVHASLVLHHLEPKAAAQMLREMARCARLGVIVNDLDRRRIYLAGAWLLSRLGTRNRYTQHDAPLSVRRAYRPAELSRLAARAGLVESARFNGLVGHRYAICFVHAHRADA